MFFDVFSYQSNQVSQIIKRESNKNNYWHILQMTDTPYSVPCSLQHGFLQILDTFLPLFLSGQRSLDKDHISGLGRGGPLNIR